MGLFYTTSFAFDGDGTYFKSVGSVKVVVTKSKPKIISKKKKTFKKSKKS